MPSVQGRILKDGEPLVNDVQMHIVEVEDGAGRPSWSVSLTLPMGEQERSMQDCLKSGETVRVTLEDGRSGPAIVVGHVPVGRVPDGPVDALIRLQGTWLLEE